MTEAERERAAIVEWLRTARPAMAGGLWARIVVSFWMIFRPASLLELVYRTCSKSIERGDHLSQQSENE